MINLRAHFGLNFFRIEAVFMGTLRINLRAHFGLNLYNTSRVYGIC